jgi:putative intracellular protease/amidase
MRRLLIFVVAVLAIPSLVLGQPTAPKSVPGGKILLIIRDAKLAEPAYLDWMITNEAVVMKETLKKAGYEVEIASPTGELWGTATRSLKPDRKLSAVNVADYEGLVIPCLGIESNELHPDLATVIKSAVAKGKAVAAQNAGVAMLAKAGVLSGKKYAALDLTVPELKSGIYSGSGVVKDGKILTSGICPGMAREYKGMQDGTPKLMEALITELNQAR